MEGKLHDVISERIPDNRESRISESFVKWLAGLVDSDGSISFFQERNIKYGYYLLRLTLQIGSSDAFDKEHRMLDYIRNTTWMGTIKTDKRVINGKVYKTWCVLKTSEIEALLPRLIKHLVVKGRHALTLFDTWKRLKGDHLSEEDIESLRLFSKQSRAIAGPVKSKNHPSFAWTAGFCDGDACFNIQYRKDRPTPLMSIEIIQHKNDYVGIELLQKAFGGKISKKKEHLLIWRRNLGLESSSFTNFLLPKLLRYSTIKKHRIEQILHFHSQRLNEEIPMGKVIVQ